MKKQPNKITTRIDAVVRAVNRGVTYAQIAERFGCSRQYVLHVLKKAGHHADIKAARAARSHRKQAAQEVEKRERLAELLKSSRNRHHRQFARDWDAARTDAERQQLEYCYHRFCAFRRNAKARGVEFTLEWSDLIWPSHCPALGVRLAYSRKRMFDDYIPSFDRFDPSKGYVPGNVHVISWRANRIKNNATPAELKAIALYALRIQRQQSESVSTL